MNIQTHHTIDRTLCGEPIMVENGTSHVRMECTEEMGADSSGLIHGGFIFGLADYAAMLAVNHPNVVLGAAETRFLKPSRIGNTLVAKAHDTTPHERKHTVHVDVFCEDEQVFTGTFTCFVTPNHILADG
ncbi:PaaI family thioesterase [Pseudodesulfovibrio piezophilus]|uniref:Thioesterase superfamily protein n=1 Tax=Pseudodesulfovibrio piezophilus (strain DSM 21447 / JCM 15486 / C1TLV30) TaxID=1322246 RepID=M1WKY7_PSEP2|nr:hotdog domain-containing protein [Pseudodesulfovibrio piezophilus]CCH50416.1 Thioesterase superfamily protein [Pseudodesulfovibrio piezophilus C1TLV30]